MDVGENYAKSLMIPSHFVKTVDAYHLFDKGNYKDSMELLSDPAVDADWKANIIQTLTECNQHSIALKFIHSQSVMKNSEYCTAVLPVFARCSFYSALDFIREKCSLLPIGSFGILLKECFSPERKDYIMNLLHTTLLPEEESILKDYCVNSKKIICHDFLVSYFVTRSKYADSLSIFNDINTSKHRQNVRHVQSLIIPSQRTDFSFDQKLNHESYLFLPQDSVVDLEQDDKLYVDNMDMDMDTHEDTLQKEIDIDTEKLDTSYSPPRPTQPISDQYSSSPIISTYTPIFSTQKRQMADHSLTSRIPTSTSSPIHVLNPSTIKDRNVRNTGDFHANTSVTSNSTINLKLPASKSSTDDYTPNGESLLINDALDSVKVTDATSAAPASNPITYISAKVDTDRPHHTSASIPSSNKISPILNSTGMRPVPFLAGHQKATLNQSEIFQPSSITSRFAKYIYYLTKAM
jgi:hypothetical protein